MGPLQPSEKTHMPSRQSAYRVSVTLCHTISFVALPASFHEQPNRLLRFIMTYFIVKEPANQHQYPQTRWIKNTNTIQTNGVFWQNGQSFSTRDPYERLRTDFFVPYIQISLSSSGALFNMAPCFFYIHFRCQHPVLIDPDPSFVPINSYHCIDSVYAPKRKLINAQQ